MPGPFQRRIGIALAASAASIAVWAWVPGTSLDRAAFAAVCRAFTNPPYFVNGEGKPSAPWQLRSFTDNDRIDPAKTPVVISLGDDPNNIFQSSPQSPLDLAVILSNFQRHGVTRPAIAAVLAWDNPDVMSFNSLETKLASFPSVTMAAPLARGAVPETMPPSFRRASIPLEKVAGDGNTLPVVNRVPVSGVILGGENCTAGFQSIDSDQTGGRPPMLARWDDRVVFAFPLVAAMQHLTVSPQQVEVRLGEWVKLGPKGPTLPIDRFGRLTMPLPEVSARTTVPAEDLIDADPGIIPDADRSLVFLRDDHSAADSATRAFSRSLATISTAITSDAGLRQAAVFRRAETRTELATLGGLTLIIAWLAGRTRFQQTVGFLSLAGLCLISQWLAAGFSQLWFPGIAAMGGVFTAALLCRILPEKASAPVSVVESEPPSKVHSETKPTEPTSETPTSEAVPEAVAEPPTKKPRATKTTPAKPRKAAAKKAPQKRGKPKKDS